MHNNTFPPRDYWIPQRHVSTPAESEKYTFNWENWAYGNATCS